MRSVAVPAAIMAGVTFYAAVYHALLHVRTGQQLQRDARFSILAFGIALYDLVSAQLYLSESVAAGALWQRLQTVLLSFLATVFIYFVDSCAELAGPKMLRRCALVFSLLGLVALLERRGWLLTGEPAIKHVQVSWFGEVVYYEQATGPLFPLICSAIAYVLLYTVIVSLAAWRKGRRRRACALALGVSLFVAGVTNDGLIAAGYIHSIYLTEYAFTSILLLINYAFSAEIVAAARATQALAEREMALSHARRLESVGRLAGGVAHDLNNMLTPVISYLELAQDLLSPGSPEHHYVSSASDAAGRAAALAQQLLALGRKQVLELQTMDLGKGLNTLAPLIRHLLPPSVTIEIDVAPGTPLIEADTNQLDQVWMNLAANARDAMPLGGKLSFTVGRTKDGDGVCVTVQDSGMGMTSATAERVFEPFFTTKPRGKGTGLGLSIVRGIVEQHGGRIELHSAVDEGTTFRLYFPASPPSAPREAAPSPTAKAPRDEVRPSCADLPGTEDESVPPVLTHRGRK